MVAASIQIVMILVTMSLYLGEWLLPWDLLHFSLALCPNVLGSLYLSIDNIIII